VPQILTAGDFYQCTFTATVSGNAGASEIDTVTASGTDSGNNRVSASTSATVTITNLPSSISVLKTANPTSVPEPGGVVTFTVRVNNTSAVDSVTISSLTDDRHGNLTGQGNCAVPRTIMPGGFYQCRFRATVSGTPGTSETDIVTASGTDDDGVALSATDNATVTITNVLPTISIAKTANPTSVPEPGGPVTFTIVVTNTGIETVTLTSLVDNPHGDLIGQSTCNLPQTIIVNDSYTCAFTATVAGNAGVSETDTITATASDDDNSSVNASARATVTVADLPSSIVVRKIANPSSIIEPGGTITFTVWVTNTSLADSVTLTNLRDDIHGNLNGQGTCSPPTLPVGSFYECAFTATVLGSAGQVETDTVTASGIDDDGQAVSGSDEATVTLTPALPGIQVSKTASTETATAGQTLTYTYRVTNTGNVNLSNLEASDDRLGAVTLGAVTLTPGQSTGGVLTYVVKADDLPGPLLNTVIVSGTPPLGSPVSATAVAAVNLINLESNTHLIYLPLIMKQNQTAPPNPEPGTHFIYLPLISRQQNRGGPPDLVITELSLIGNKVEVVIKNQGGTSVVNGFWVDVYFDPHPVPTHVNQIWDDGRSAYGLVWGVTTPIAPNETLTLTIGDAYFWPKISKWPATVPSGTPIYAQVDSINLDTNYGGVLESHEMNGGPYNNIIGPIVVTGLTNQGAAPIVSGEGKQRAGSDPLPTR